MKHVLRSAGGFVVLLGGLAAAVEPRSAETVESVRAETMRPYEAAPLPDGPRIENEGLAGRVLCGYQGWFNAEGDGAHLGWAHWAKDSRRPPTTDNLSIDLLPDVGELDDHDRHATGLLHPDGTPIEVFSSRSPTTVDCHFRWMREYGIDGAFVQRFVAPLKSPRHLRNSTIVLGNCREAAIRQGRVFAVMYDISGLGAGQASHLLDDWRALRDRMRVTENPAYLRLGGKPLVAVWGIGFSGKAYTSADCREIVAALEADGCAVMAGVPTGWRTLDRDAGRDAALHEVVAMCDVVSPWTVGRYSKPEAVAKHADTSWKPDIEWCRDRSIAYLPVVFPGFSWRNLHGGPLDQIPRQQGEFLWRQFAEASRVGGTSVYVAMFDECDEGTAIFKCAAVPGGELASLLIDYEGLSSDHYLRLTGAARKLFQAGGAFPTRPPIPVSRP